MVLLRLHARLRGCDNIATNQSQPSSKRQPFSRRCQDLHIAIQRPRLAPMTNAGQTVSTMPRCRRRVRYAVTTQTRKAPLATVRQNSVVISAIWWLRGLDLNQRPSGYEPDELPDCSTPRHRAGSIMEPALETAVAESRNAKRADLLGSALRKMNGFSKNSYPLAAMPGDDLLFQRLSVSTIGAVWFHGRVRDGIGWVTDAMVTKQWCQRVRVINRCDIQRASGWYRPTIAANLGPKSRTDIDDANSTSANRTIRTG